MQNKIDYKCVDCGNVFDISLESHLDEIKYAECGCGERAEPLNASDNATKDTKKTQGEN